jgi:mRNA interferase RelE/StbE
VSAQWRYEFTSAADRDLRRLDPTSRRRIIEALDRLAADPFYGGDVRKLRGADREWRLRIGGWRVRFERDEDNRIIWVLGVSARDRAYRG